MDMNDPMVLGKIKPPRDYVRGATVGIMVRPHVRDRRATFLQWVRSRGWVLQEEPWYAKVINEEGRIEVVHSSKVRTYVRTV